MTSTKQKPVSDLWIAIGGDEGLRALVGALYFHLLQDVRLARFFLPSDAEILIVHQRRFLSTVIKGESVDLIGLHQAHAELIGGLGLNDGHFDILKTHLAYCLEDLGHDISVREEVLTQVELLRTPFFARN